MNLMNGMKRRKKTRMRKFTFEYQKGQYVCDICYCHYERKHGRKIDKKVAKLTFYTQDYNSNNLDKICTTLQQHVHELWICDKCINDLGMEWVRTFDKRYKVWHKEEEHGTEI